MNMAHLYKKIFLLVSTTAFLFATVVVMVYCFVLPQYALHSGAFRYKKSLSESIDANKILIVGDSNAARGISAKILTERTGIHAVNLALSRPNGHIFNNNFALFSVKPGDIVLSCYTDYDYDADELNYEAMLALLENNFDTYSMLKGLSIPHLAFAFPQYIESAMLRFLLRQSINGDDYHLNEFGDSDHELDVAKVLTKEELSYVPTYNARGIAIMNAFNAKLREKGATLLVASAPMPYGEFMTEGGGKNLVSILERIKG